MSASLPRAQFPSLLFPREKPLFLRTREVALGAGRSRRDVQRLESSLVIINAVARGYKQPLIYVVLVLY